MFPFLSSAQGINYYVYFEVSEVIEIRSRFTISTVFTVTTYILGVKRSEPRGHSIIVWQLCASRVLREERVFHRRQTFAQAGWWRWA